MKSSPNSRTECRVVVARSWGRKARGITGYRYGISVGEEEDILKVDGGAFHSMSALHTTELHAWSGSKVLCCVFHTTACASVPTNHRSATYRQINFRQYDCPTTLSPTPWFHGPCHMLGQGSPSIGRGLLVRL